jgi:hypothetical protein
VKFSVFCFFVIHSAHLFRFTVNVCVRFVDSEDDDDAVQLTEDAQITGKRSMYVLSTLGVTDLRDFM